MTKKIYFFTVIATIFICKIGFSQVVFWTENFNNGCSSNCNASAYTGTNGSWSVSNTGTNGSVANEFFISCAENGEAVGACGAGCGNDATLHVGNVPCTLCFVCPAGDCGATYNAGPAFNGEDPATNKRAESPLISTLGKSTITLSFKYIERGQGTTDDATVEYSTNGGLVWTALTNPAKTPTTCASGQGLWTALSFVLPPACDNINNLKIGFRWVNNSNSGNDPSFAVDNVELSTAVSSPPVASFSTPNTIFCDSTCISFTDSSQNSPTSWNWLFPGATPASFSGQTPTNICYNTPGNYDVTLIVSNAAGSDTTTQTNYIVVNSCYLPQVSFSATDTFFCEKNCINFTDLSTNNPISWQWYFTGANPDTSTFQNPSNICYDAYGNYSVKLIATNIIGSDSIEYTSYITVNQSPASPVITLSGGNILTCTPASNFQWYYNSAAITGAFNQVHLAQATGDYYVIITDSNGCQAVSNSVFVGFNGIENHNFIDLVDIAPNPIQNNLIVIINSTVEQIVIMEITDLSGRLLSREPVKLQQGKNNFNRDFSKVDPGTYLLTIYSENGQIAKKISKF